MLCTQFYCNTSTHQESDWIHISVVSLSHFVITPSQSKSICPPLSTNLISNKMMFVSCDFWIQYEKRFTLHESFKTYIRCH
jgi:hypothetical protein